MTGTRRGVLALIALAALSLAGRGHAEEQTERPYYITVTPVIAGPSIDRTAETLSSTGARSELRYGPTRGKVSINSSPNIGIEASIGYRVPGNEGNRFSIEGLAGYLAFDGGVTATAQMASADLGGVQINSVDMSTTRPGFEMSILYAGVAGVAHRGDFFGKAGIGVASWDYEMKLSGCEAKCGSVEYATGTGRTRRTLESSPVDAIRREGTDPLWLIEAGMQIPTRRLTLTASLRFTAIRGDAQTSGLSGHFGIRY